MVDVRFGNTKSIENIKWKMNIENIRCERLVEILAHAEREREREREREL